MESYLVDEAVLGGLVDAILKEKYPNQPVKDHADIKKNLVKKLDRQILKAIVGSLTPEQGNELNAVLEKDDQDPVVFENFFKDHDIDLEKVVTDAVVAFKNDFMKEGKDE